MTAPDGRLQRTLAESHELLVDSLDEVDFEIERFDFFLLELARLAEEGRATFEDAEFRGLVREAIRLHVNPDEGIRARIAGRLRRDMATMDARSHRVAAAVVAAVEDTDFSLEDVGAVAGAYARALVRALESEGNGDGDPSADSAARKAASDWIDGSLARTDLEVRLGKLGDDALPAIADLLLDSPGDASTTDAALDLLSERNHPVAARTLAFAVSEPLLGEGQEQRALDLLKRTWPQGRTFILYRLRQHAHDDIPYRWLELLVDADEVHAVDRILEELVTHARETPAAEDLRSILRLLDRSQDPGLEGKIVRFMTSAAAPPEALDLIEEWLGEWMDQTAREGVAIALARWNEGIPVLVPAGKDFLDFAAGHGGISLEEAWPRWSAAYHEDLGWRRYGDHPWSPYERELDRELLDLIAGLTGPGRLDTASARPLVEDTRERRLLEGDPPPLGAILDGRPRGDSWARNTFRRETNNWYVRAATAYDDGDPEKSKRILGILLAVAPEAPLARMLAGLVGEAGSR